MLFGQILENSAISAIAHGDLESDGVFSYYLPAMDYDLKRCTRNCAATEREFTPGETFYSTLTAEGAELVRLDFCTEAWKGPPEGVVGWWKSQMPDAKAKKVKLAPNDVILGLFEQLAEQPEKQDMRYVLSLLLVRRRVVRLEEDETDEQGHEVMVVYCPRRDTTYRVQVVTPDEQRVDQIQEELSKLLFADTA